MFKLDAVIRESKALVPPKSLNGAPMLRGVWEAAVGTRIACRAEPVRLDKGVLHVRVKSSAWANELALLTSDILAQLHGRGVRAEALRFSVGPLTTPQPRREEPRPAAPKNARLPSELVPSVSRIQDEGLRAAVSEAAAKTLIVLAGRKPNQP